jgi:hypothetical protein
VSSIEGLVQAYRRFVGLPWERGLAGPQKVWFAIYEPSQERRLRPRLEEFKIATLQAGHTWAFLDLTDTFAHWMAEHEYREEYFAQPEDMELALDDFAAYAAEQLTAALSAPDVDEDTVVAVAGVASLFGLLKVSALLERAAAAVRGRLLLFFPGQHEGSNYRLLDARDGWNYLAVPITAADGS